MKSQNELMNIAMLYPIFSLDPAMCKIQHNVHTVRNMGTSHQVTLTIAWLYDLRMAFGVFLCELLKGYMTLGTDNAVHTGLNLSCPKIIRRSPQ